MTAEAPGVDLTRSTCPRPTRPGIRLRRRHLGLFYIKGPGIAEKGDATYKMAQILEDDFFNEVDAIEKGDLSHAAKFRFTHAEIMIPFAAIMGLKGMSEGVPQAATFTYADNPWRGQTASPRRWPANMQWTSTATARAGCCVKMLYNEQESDFKAACDGAKIAAGQPLLRLPEARRLLRPPGPLVGFIGTAGRLLLQPTAGVSRGEPAQLAG